MSTIFNNCLHIADKSAIKPGMRSRRRKKEQPAIPVLLDCITGITAVFITITVAQAARILVDGLFTLGSCLIARFRPNSS